MMFSIVENLGIHHLGGRIEYKKVFSRQKTVFFRAKNVFLQVLLQKLQFSNGTCQEPAVCVELQRRLLRIECTRLNKKSIVFSFFGTPVQVRFTWHPPQTNLKIPSLIYPYVPRCSLQNAENPTSISVSVLELFNLPYPIFYFEMDSRTP